MTKTCFQKKSSALLALVFLAFLLAGELGPASAAPPVAYIDAGLVERARAEQQPDLGALVTFDHTLTASDLGLLSGHGLTVLRAFPAFHTIYATGSGASILDAASLPGVIHVRGDDQLTLLGNTATVSTRAREAWDGRSTSTNPVQVGGVTIDGAGVGIAIIDSGIDATHPDLAPAVAANLKYVCSTPGLLFPARTCYGNAVASEPPAPPPPTPPGSPPPHRVSRAL